MRQSIHRTILKATLLLCASPLFAQANADAIIQTVEDHYNHLSSLKARYVEHYRGMGLDRTEAGTLLLKKPGRMRWSYDQPAGKVFILDGKYGWFYTPGDSQAQRIPVKQLDDLRSPLRFLLGRTQLKKELDNITVVHEETDFRISGVPKGMQERIRQLSLWVNGSGVILKMKIEEVDGSITEFDFFSVEENVPIKNFDFTFSAPEGVTVVEGLPPV